RSVGRDLGRDRRGAAGGPRCPVLARRPDLGPRRARPGPRAGRGRARRLRGDGAALRQDRGAERGVAGAPPMPVEALVAALGPRWPAVRVAPETVGAVLATRGLAPDAAHPLDVALACALAAGDRAALEVFERQLVPDIRGAVARLDPSGALADDALQQVREKLLVGGASPRSPEYRRPGSLAGWLQLIALRQRPVQRRT